MKIPHQRSGAQVEQSSLSRDNSVGCVAGTRPGPVRRVQAGAVGLACRSWVLAGAAPLVLLHALGEQSSDWVPVARALASSWCVCAPDLRGHGASDWAGPYAIEQLATDLAALVDALELGQVALGGIR
jgi:3-oxoadipate enol-lactonase